MHNIAEIRTQITMKSIKKTLHELSAHIPQKAPIRNISSLTNEMMHMDIIVSWFGAYVVCGHICQLCRRSRVRYPVIPIMVCRRVTARDEPPPSTIVNMVNLIISYKKKHLRPPNKKKKRGKNLSPRNRKACHRHALLKSVAEIGTQSAMKSSRKTLHEFTSHIPR
jgi:hypothetical protein